jgi:outer membrane receptor for ferric coprogen and ferric-rhodotorulic acid
VADWHVSTNGDGPAIWLINADYTYIRMKIYRIPPSTDASIKLISKTAPQHQFHLGTSFDLPWNLKLDGNVWWMDDIDTIASDPYQSPIDDYWRIDLRLAWQATGFLELAVVGQNLSNEGHDEYSEQNGIFPTRIPRSAYAQATFEF